VYLRVCINFSPSNRNHNKLLQFSHISMRHPNFSVRTEILVLIVYSFSIDIQTSLLASLNNYETKVITCINM
jgi:hypothetical protein